MGKQKVTSYMKLKKEVESLKRELITVCCNPDSIDGVHVKMKWKLLSDIENQVMSGTHTMPEPTPMPYNVSENNNFTF